MKILFVHQNFPGQYLHLARHLGATPGNQVIFITQRSDVSLPGVGNVVYQPMRAVTPGIHHYLAETEAGVLNAQNVARVALDLKQQGFVPDIMLGHNGWGELWFLKDVYPDVPLIGYFEFFYQRYGADVGFHPNDPTIFDTAPRLRTKNLGNLLALHSVDAGQCPTLWQKSLYPVEYQSKIRVVHEGINTCEVAPNPLARFKISSSNLELSASDEVITFVARNLEPYRGFPEFMRSLPDILARRPNARVLVVGGDETSYGPAPENGQTYRQLLVNELNGSIDLDRVHFLGKVPYPQFIEVLQISTVHVYLTYPFVLSWSMLEAMSAGCLVIGSRTAPVEEVIVDGQNGVLVDFFDQIALAETVVDALTHRQSYVAIREAARRTIIERFDLQTICLPAQLTMLDEVIRG
jgi:glycosyltransferase involved in cell wall biosynthesis